MVDIFKILIGLIGGNKERRKLKIEMKINRRENE